MALEANSSFNINSDNLYPIINKKNTNKVENAEKLSPKQLDSTEKDVSIPIKDVNCVEKQYPKIMLFDPGKFEDYFSDMDVAEAKKLVKGIVKASDKGEFADKVRDFYKVTDKMDKNELIKTAEFLGDQMTHTDGRDDVLGSLLMGVLGEINSRDNLPIYIKGAHKIPTFPTIVNYADNYYDENTKQEHKITEFKFNF